MIFKVFKSILLFKMEIIKVLKSIGKSISVIIVAIKRTYPTFIFLEDRIINTVNKKISFIKGIVLPS